MNEEKDRLRRVSTENGEGRRIPVASANGAGTAKLNDNLSNRRKRIRVSTSDARGEGYTTKRFPQKSSEHNALWERGNRDFNKQQGRRDRLSAHSTSSQDNPDYEKRYQDKREEGGFSYNYNRSQGAKKKGSKDSRGGYNKNKKVAKKSGIRKVIEPITFPMEIDSEQGIRLNKFLANSGLCSRREADLLIELGDIEVNGAPVYSLGSRVFPSDIITYQGVPVSVERKIYVLLNKPKNCVTTVDDPKGRMTVMDIVKNACSERIYPVGRLDRHTTGLLLLTNDGDLTSRLTHPSFEKKKIYHVWLDKGVTVEDMQRIAEGIELEDGEIHADALSYVKEDDQTQVGIEIHSGRNRIIRRIFEHLGYKVIKLDRVYFAGLTKKNLSRGRWRYLTEQEVRNLKMGAFD